MNIGRYALGAILGAAIAAGLFRIWQVTMGPEQTGATPAAAILAVAPNGRDWMHGPTSAATTLLMYGDFACTACREYFRAVERLERDEPNTFRFVYRHYLIDRTRPNSRAAAIAAEAAGKQRKFWEYADVLFARQTEWVNEERVEELLERYAHGLKLDATRFRRDFNDPSVRKKVNDDIRSARRSGVSGAPAFFKNGVGVAPPKTYSELERIVSGESARQ